MVEVNLIFTQLLNGFSIGLSIALVAMGLTLVFGVLNIVNLAHGEFFMLGGYGIFLLYPSIIGSFTVAVVLSAFIVSLIAILIEQLTLRPIRDRDPINTLIVTFAWIFILEQLAFEFFGGRTKTIEAPLQGSLNLVGISYPIWRLVVIVAGILTSIFIYVLLKRTRIGILIRASGDNLDMTRALGVSSRLIYISVFAFSAFLAVIAAGLVTPIQGVKPTIGISILIPAFIAVIIGGLGSVTGTFIAAVFVGVISSVSAIWLSPWITDITIFLLLIIILLYKPEGIFGHTQARN
jgi:branched-subunit amino acid ABC-type transport system permease component